MKKNKNEIINKIFLELGVSDSAKKVNNSAIDKLNEIKSKKYNFNKQPQSENRNNSSFNNDELQGNTLKNKFANFSGIKNIDLSFRQEESFRSVNNNFNNDNFVEKMYVDEREIKKSTEKVNPLKMLESIREK